LRSQVLDLLADDHDPLAAWEMALAWVRPGDLATYTAVLTPLASDLAQTGHPGLLLHALAAAEAIDDQGFRAEALAALAPFLPEPLLLQALATAQALPDREALAKAVTALTPHLPEPLRLRALEQTLQAASYCAELAVLAPHLPDALLTRALEVVLAIGNAGQRSAALAILAPYLSAMPAADLYSLWSRTLPRLASRTRSDLFADLRALLPVIIRLGGSQAVADTFQAIQDISQWWL
jgi:hypothetical protein